MAFGKAMREFEPIFGSPKGLVIEFPVFACIRKAKQPLELKAHPTKEIALH